MDQFKAIHRHCRKLRHEISNMAKFESNLSRTDGKRATWRNFANVHTREGEVCVPYLNKCWFELWSFPTFQSYIVVSSQHIVLKFGNFYSFYVTSPYSVERFSLTDPRQRLIIPRKGLFTRESLKTLRRKFSNTSFLPNPKQILKIMELNQVKLLLGNLR